VALGVCEIFRNEAPYMREWIEFHRLVGVDRFYRYQKNSDDDWEEILRPYVRSGIVEVIDWPLRAPAQVPAHHHFVSTHIGQHEWVAFIDCDEFLFSPRYNTVSEVLNQEPFARWGAVGVNWMCFGASGHEGCGDGLVVERFIQRPPDAFGTNGFVKCIVRMDSVESAGLNAHRFNVAGGSLLTGAGIWALLARRAYHVYRPMNLEPMRIAARHLIGEHDFRSFCGVLPEGGGTTRVLKSLEIESRGPYLRFDIAADGFLHRMVRTIVGTLVECGRGRREPHSMPSVLGALRREAAGVTAPACGLYLAGVKYRDGYDSYREPPIF